MKKYETLTAEAKKIADSKKELAIENSVAIATEQNDILALLLFIEVKKALENKETKLILDCDYEQSRTADKLTNYNYYHIISTDKTADNKLQLKHDSKNNYHFNISVKYLDKLTEQSDITFTVKRDKSNRAKNIKVKATYETLVDTFKTIQSIMREQ